MNNNDKNVLSNVISRDGYVLQLSSSRVPIEFFTKPEWIALKPDQRMNLNVLVLETHQTNIYLDHVWNRETDLYFHFHTTFNMNKSGGQFLYNGIFNEDLTFTNGSSPFDFELFDKNKLPVPIGQTGTGPESDFGFGIEPENQKSI